MIAKGRQQHQKLTGTAPFVVVAELKVCERGVCKLKHPGLLTCRELTAIMFNVSNLVEVFKYPVINIQTIAGVLRSRMQEHSKKWKKWIQN